MICAVFDCNIIISAIGWKGLPRYCVDLVVSGQIKLCVTTDIWQEYDTMVAEVFKREGVEVDPQAMLGELLQVAHFVDPAPLGKRRSRDAKDDIYLTCALGAGADAIVTNDRDLLDLEKPFGIQIMTPIEFLKLVRSGSSF